MGAHGSYRYFFDLDEEKNDQLGASNLDGEENDQLRVRNFVIDKFHGLIV